MANDNEKEDDDVFAIESDYPERDDDQEGPPDDWAYPSWYSKRENDWWWRDERTRVWRRDPCPARPQGMGNGEYVFSTVFGEIRTFTSGQLHGRGGLADLFVGQMWWPLRHFRKYDIKEKKLTGDVQLAKCVQALICACSRRGYYDGSKPLRGFGTWRGPIVHAGDRIFDGDKIHPPGVELDGALFVIGATREPPAHELEGHDRFHWMPAPAMDGHKVAAHLDEWAWDSAEARDLFQGGLHCDMLCSALSWLPHKFVLAPYGSGKSALLRYARTLVGAGAHNVLQTYSKAYLEQNYSGSAAAFYLDEAESDEEAVRIRRIFELVRLLSGDGAEGGRGSSSGKARRLDVHGTVTMAATVTGEWPPQARSRITVLELQPLCDRDGTPASPEQLAAQLELAKEMSAGLRARALATWPLFLENLRYARGAIMKMGGTSRDADQLGHLAAGWKTMTSDQAFGDNDDLARFRPFIMSLVEAEEGEDAPSDLLNALFSSSPDLWRSGERMTVGELIAAARSDATDAQARRKQLGTIGLRLGKLPNETWTEAWLWVANKHANLDRLFAGYADKYTGKKRSQILIQLRRRDKYGAEHKAKKGAGPSWFGKASSRFVMVPPIFLPGDDDEPDD
jgi:hypothetical protein